MEPNPVYGMEAAGNEGHIPTQPNPVYGMETASNEGHIPTQPNPVYGVGTARISPVVVKNPASS